MFVHFHSVPYLPPTSQAKARALVERLTEWQYDSRLYLVPFGEIQREVVLAVPGPARVVVYRRLMIRIAEAIGRREGALALATGESLGQVASQTLENIAAIDAAAEGPVLRPLIGTDKIEIIQRGQAARHLRDLDRARRRLLHAVRARPPAHAHDAGPGRGRRVAAGGGPAGRRRRRGGRAGALRVPGPGRRPQHLGSLTAGAHNRYGLGMLRRLSDVDPEVAKALRQEAQRQHRNLELIASENFVSEAVLEATGSVLTNKYAEGYPGRRYYGGCEVVDVVEELAIARAKELFGCEHANVQPHSGAQANMAVYFTLLKPGDVVLGPNLSHGGHLTAGSPVNYSGKFYSIVAYGVRRDTERIDLDQVRDLARQHRPKLIIAGGSAFPRAIDFAPFGEIAREVGRHAHGRHRAPGRPRRRRPAPLTDRGRRLRDDHHPQDAAGAARAAW